MGSNETATATTGGPRVIDVFDGNGAPSGPNYTLFRGQIGSWRPLGVGLVVGKRLHRLRHRCSSLEVSEPRPALNLLKLLCLLRELAKICLKRRRVRCRRLRATTADPKRPQGDLRATNRQDSTGAAAMARPSISRIKKNIFFAPQ